VLVGASVSGCQFSTGASFQGMPVFSGCEFSVGASLQWVRVFSGCQSSVRASEQFWVFGRSEC
jgi:hypothetical protein